MNFSNDSDDYDKEKESVTFNAKSHIDHLNTLFQYYGFEEVIYFGVFPNLIAPELTYHFLISLVSHTVPVITTALTYRLNKCIIMTKCYVNW